MEIKDASITLAALANEHRLKIFRLLVRQGPNGLAAGQIAEALDIPASTLSFHLSHLSNAGLVSARRLQRKIFYAVSVDRTRQILAFLTEDCCEGRPELCPGLTQAADQMCCAEAD